MYLATAATPDRDTLNAPKPFCHPKGFPKPNQYLPERWTPALEKSYYAIMFNQGPQRCPAKEFAILIMQLAFVNYLRYSGILQSGSRSLQCNKQININHMPQMINPCHLQFTILK